MNKVNELMQKLESFHKTMGKAEAKLSELMLERDALKEQNAALAAQVEQLEICLKERKAVCHQAFDANDALTAERDALAAQVEMLRSDVEYIKGKLYILKAGVYVRRDTDKAYARCESVLSKTPQQHLAEIRAEAGRAGFIAALTAEMDIGKETEAADRYADSIRQGEVK